MGIGKRQESISGGMGLNYSRPKLCLVLGHIFGLGSFCSVDIYGHHLLLYRIDRGHDLYVSMIDLNSPSAQICQGYRIELGLLYVLLTFTL